MEGDFFQGRARFEVFRLIFDPHSALRPLVRKSEPVISHQTEFKDRTTNQSGDIRELVRGDAVRIVTKE
jgi:hypothetical protein